MKKILNKIKKYLTNKYSYITYAALVGLIILQFIPVNIVISILNEDNAPSAGAVNRTTQFRTNGNSIVQVVTSRDFGIGNIATNSATFSVDPGNNIVAIIGHFSGATASLSGNFQTSGRIIGGLASHSLAGSFSGAGLSDCNAAGDTLNWDAASGKFTCGTDEAGLGIRTEEGGVQVQAAATILNFSAGSFNLTASGSTETVVKNRECFTFANGAPSSTDQWGGKKFLTAWTILSVSPVASGSGAAGWRLLHGAGGSVTTTVFTEIKSASTATYPDYTGGFADSTIQAGHVLDFAIASPSADLAELGVTVCGEDT